jgi:hypothetical protein
LYGGMRTLGIGTLSSTIVEDEPRTHRLLCKTTTSIIQRRLINEWVYAKVSAYDIEQFVWLYAIGTTAPEFEGWHGVYPDSYFSGVLIRLSDDGETVQMGTYFC